MPVTRRQMLAATAAVLAAGSPRSSARPRAGHVVLLGDSIFDNGVYVGDGPAVIDQLRAHLPTGWRASLLAVDGDVTADVATQMRDLPEDTTHLLVSVGGNDALQSEPVLVEPVTVVGQALLALADVRAAFAADYGAMLDAVLAAGRPAAVCTIYDPNLADAERQRGAVVALAVFNDVITRAAVERGLPVVDLRVLFGAPEDYANPIEPSAVGGEKLARTIAAMIAAHDFAAGRTTFYGRG